MEFDQIIRVIKILRQYPVGEKCYVNADHNEIFFDGMHPSHMTLEHTNELEQLSVRWDDETKAWKENS